MAEASVLRKPLYAWLRQNVGLILLIAAAAISMFTFSVFTSSDTPLGLKPKRVWTLMIINIVILGILGSIITTRIFKLWSALKSGSGSRLQKRILVLFSIVTIVPTILVSVFSALFFNLGIQIWFNDRVQTAVGQSLVVAEAYLNEHKDNLRADAVAMAGDLNQVAGLAYSDPEEFSRTVVAQSALRELTESIVIQRNRIIAQGHLSFALAFEHIPQDALERAAKGEVVIMGVENDKVRALIKLDGLPDGYLLIGRLIDAKVLAHMDSAQGAVHEYNALKTQLDRLQIIFSVIFVTLALLLLLSSIGYGMVFAGNLTKPISSLVKAAERVRAGDFSARVTDSAGKDELGMLSRSFNRMTEQLEAQRHDLIEANRRLDERRRFSEAVLSGVSAGVIAIDRNHKITLFNRSAGSILSSIEQPLTHETLIEDVLPGIDALLSKAEHISAEVVQDMLTLVRNQKSITLHARITVEKLGEEIEGFIVTFDDITQLVSAQRTAAWADVARRIAHEIKNPLTPITLAAERLKRKYAKFITEDQETFIKYTDTISKHVGDIGKIVEEFVTFARMPMPIFANEDLAGIVRKAAFSAQVANPQIDYNVNMPDAAVPFYCDERQITQVLTNLLKNAGESIETRMAQDGTSENGRISIRLACENEQVNLTIEDNGTGFPGSDLQKMFEPYVTTRAKGTGLGLAIVKKIVEDHKGKINLENISEGGARVMLSFLQHCDINAATT